MKRENTVALSIVAAFVIMSALCSSAHAGVARGSNTGTPKGQSCIQVPCTSECWAVKVTYRQVVSSPGAPPEYETQQAMPGGIWGDQTGARCYVDQISREGFWLGNADGSQMTPTNGPQKIPAAAIDFLLIQEEPF